MKKLLLIVAAAAPLSAQTPDDFVAALKRLKITGYVQPQYVSRDDGTDQFSVRRGRIKFTYQATPTSRFVLQPDISTSGVTLKDAYAELIEPWTSWKHTLTAGQFTWPFGFELLYSSSRREMPERTLVVRTLFPGERDRGVMLSGAGLDGHFDYRIAIVNGSGTQPDDDDAKDVVGRAGLAMGPVTGGISLYRGSNDKEREGIDVQWETPLPGLRLRGEFIRGVEEQAEVAGWYVYAIQDAGERHQFVVRADEYEDARTIGGAYNFRWDANSKVMLAYEDGTSDVVTVRYQFSF